MTDTPSDSAMTAEAKMLTPERLEQIRESKIGETGYWPKSPNRVIAELLDHIAALSTERTKLAADLARVNFLLAKDGEILERVLLMEKAHEEATDRALAAEAKSARLVEAARAVVISTSKLDRHGIPDTDMEPVMLGKLRALSAALTLPEPSHEP